MFDSLLNSKFYNKCKRAIKCIRMRMDPILRKKQAMLRFLKKDIADLITNGLGTHAYGRMEGLIIEINHASCYDMIVQYCEFIVKQLNSLQKQRDCPQEAMEAVSTLIFAAARFPDLPELCDLRRTFTERYGNFIEPFVSPEFVQKLHNKSFSHEEKLKAMQNIAEELSVVLDIKELELKLHAAPESTQVELAMPIPNKHKEDEDVPRERKSTPVGLEQKQEVQFKPKNIHVTPDGIGQLHRKSRKQLSYKPDDKEQLENSVSHLDMKRRNGHKGIDKGTKKDVYPCKRELMEAVELDLNGIRKQGAGSVKSPEGETNKIVKPYTKSMKAEKEDGIEKENQKGLGHSPGLYMTGGPDHDGRQVELGLKALGPEDQGFGSVNSLNDKTAIKASPYTKLNGARMKNPCEEENILNDDGPPHVSDLGHPVHDRRRVQETAANLQPLHVKLKVKKQSVHDDPADQTSSDYNKHNVAKHKDHAPVDGEVLRPVSFRRKYAKPPEPVDSYDEAPNDGRITTKTPSSHRRHSSRPAVAYDDYDEKGYLRLQGGHGINDGIGNGKHAERTRGGHGRHTNRRKGDYDGVLQHQEAQENDMDSAIDFGNLLPRAASGRRRQKNRSTNARDGGRDEEEIVMDKLLMYYSKKGLDREEHKTRTKTRTPPTDKSADGHRAQSQQGDSLHHPERAVSLPAKSVNPDEELKVPTRSTSLQPDTSAARGGHVHPKMPDFDELAARISALRKA